MAKKDLYDKNNAEKEFAKALQQLAYRQSLWQVFQDFLDFALVMLRWWDAKEEMLEDIKSRYPDPKEWELFAKAYVAMADIAESGGMVTGFETDKLKGFRDPFGDYFMEHFSNDRAGQFFTPETVTDMMAHVMISDDTPPGHTVLDCCCGSGRLLLSAAKCNRNLIFYAADLDITCVKMTTINFMLNSMKGEVAHMDSLSLEHWKSYKIHHIPHWDNEGKLYYLPMYTEHGPNDTMMNARLKATYPEEYKETKPKKQTPFKPAPKVTAQQQSLF